MKLWDPLPLVSTAGGSKVHLDVDQVACRTTQRYDLRETGRMWVVGQFGVKP